jgi:multiple sugar transport system ATP-binding protein
MNFVEGQLIAATPDTAHVSLSSGESLQVRVNATRLPIGSPVTIGVRPEDAEVGTVSQHVIRAVQWQERLGESTYLYLDSGVAGAPWVVKAPGNSFAKAGERVAMSMHPQHLHLFDAAGRALERTVTNEDLPLASAVAAA